MGPGRRWASRAPCPRAGGVGFQPAHAHRAPIPRRPGRRSTRHGEAGSAVSSPHPPQGPGAAWASALPSSQLDRTLRAWAGAAGKPEFRRSNAPLLGLAGEGRAARLGPDPHGGWHRPQGPPCSRVGAPTLAVAAPGWGPSTGLAGARAPSGGRTAQQAATGPGSRCGAPSSTGRSPAGRRRRPSGPAGTLCRRRTAGGWS